MVITLCRPSVVCPSTPLKDYSETPGPIFFKFCMAPSVNWGLKIYTNGHGPSIKMTAMAIYGKKHLKIFSRTKKAERLNLGI